MKLNRKWLHEDFVDLSHVSDKEYVEKLTVFGQKVETWERMDAEIKNVVVGKVISIVRHENSDHMWALLFSARHTSTASSSVTVKGFSSITLMPLSSA